jgi:hypothetical protein
MAAFVRPQHVTVTHVHQQVNIEDGGQAVVAGNTVTSGRIKGRRTAQGHLSPKSGLACNNISNLPPLHRAAPSFLLAVELRND